MTWSTFISAIKQSEVIKDSSPKIVIKLFDAARSPIDCSESAAKSWLNGNRNCKTARYFPNGKLIDEKAVFKIFRDRPEQILKKLQQIFREGKDADSPIDVNTKNMDVFCWSLVNQFLDILGLQRLDIPSDNNSSAFEGSTPADICENDVSEGSPPADICETESPNEPTNAKEKQMQESFLTSVREYKVMEIINRKPAILNRYDSESFNVFCDQIRPLVPGGSSLNSLESLIEIFADCLLRRVLSLDARLNNQFGYDDENASVNMEKSDTGSDEHIRKLKGLGVPELTDELLAETEDSLGLIKLISDNEWGKFRIHMNFLYDKIRCWDVSKP